MKAVNGIYDRDTAGAIAGALLGAYWGLRGIPERWAEAVYKRDEIVALADDLIEATGREAKPKKQSETMRLLDEASCAYLITTLSSPSSCN